LLIPEFIKIVVKQTLFIQNSANSRLIQELKKRWKEKQNLFVPEIRKIEAKQTLLIPHITLLQGLLKMKLSSGKLQF
jgi:hypothetical protein